MGYDIINNKCIKGEQMLSSYIVPSLVAVITIAALMDIIALFRVRAFYNKNMGRKSGLESFTRIFSDEARRWRASHMSEYVANNSGYAGITIIVNIMAGLALFALIAILAT